MNRTFGLLAARAWMNVCAFVSFVVVARHLDAGAFGIYAVAASAIALPVSMIGVGLADHVIARDPDRVDEGTAFWCAVALGAFSTVVAAAIAIGLMQTKSGAGIGQILLVLSAIPILWGPSVIFEAALIRDSRGTALAATLFLAETIGLAAVFVGLWLNWGVYSLVWSRVVNQIITLSGYLITAHDRPAIQFKKASLERLGGFTAGLLATRSVNWANSFGQDIILAPFLTATGVGHLRMSTRLISAVAGVAVFALGPAHLAYMGEQAKHSLRQAPRKMLRVLQVHFALILPIFFSIAILSKDLVAVLLGPRWAETANALAIFALGAPMGLVGLLVTCALTLAGRTRVIFLLQLTLTVSVIAAAIAVSPLGLAAVAAVKVLIEAGFAIGGVFLVRGLSRPTFRRIILALAGPLASLPLMALAMFWVLHQLPPGDGRVYAVGRLVVAGTAGLVAYTGVLLFTARPAVRHAKLMGRGLRTRLTRSRALG